MPRALVPRLPSSSASRLAGALLGPAALLAAALLLTGAGGRPGAVVPSAGGAEQPRQELSSLTVVAEAQASSVSVEAPAPEGEPALEEAPAAEASAANAAAAPAGPTVPLVAALAERWRAEGIVLITGGQAWDAASLANVDAALRLLPPAVRAALGNRALGPLHILVNREGRSLSGRQPYGGPANYFSTNDGLNEVVLYPGQGVATVLHELGHAYNLRSVPAGRYALVLLDGEMQSFMAATGWRLASTPEQVLAAVDQRRLAYVYEGGFMWPRLSHHDPLEDFADSFALYYADPARLHELSPARYGWFAGHLPR